MLADFEDRRTEKIRGQILSITLDPSKKYSEYYKIFDQLMRSQEQK